MNRIFTIAAAVVAFLVAFTGTAMAASLPDAESLIDLARPVLAAVKSGQGYAAAALALVLMTALARRFGAKRWPWLNSDAGGSLLTLVGSFGGAVATALAAGSLPTLGLAWTAFGVAVAASGGYTMVKRLIVPGLVWLQSRLPGWAQPVLSLVLWMFTKPDPIAVAEKAGNEAVAANPGKGIEGVTGGPDRKFP